MSRTLVPRHPSRTLVLAGVLAMSFLVAPAASLVGDDLLPPGVPLPAPVPEVVEGFVVQPLAATNGNIWAALAFGPGDGDGPDLYAAGGSSVARIPLTWTPAGPVPGAPVTWAGGFNSALGVVFDADGAAYVADSHPGGESGRTDGVVWRVAPDGASKEVIVDGLPNGRHNTNHLRFGPDSRLYIANGNPNDNGVGGGEADVLPVSGAILSVDAAQVTGSPAVLHWEDANGDAIPEEDVFAHARNADFRSKVQVYASGFRNVFGIAFHPALGIGYTAENGADSPSDQDSLYRITPGTDYGFPFCYNAGPPGGVGAQVAKVNNPLFPAHDCSPAAHPPADALLGWHVCATGLDFPTAGPWAFPAAFQGSVFVGECGPFFPHDTLAQMLADPLTHTSTHNTGHKVARVALDAQGQATGVHDFLSGLALPTDVLFGPDGAMYVADAVAVHRVAPVLAAPGALL